MSTAEKKSLTAQEYLAIERKADTRSQYDHGEMFAMTGASRAHNLITGNVLRRISEHLDDRPCEVYANDMRVKVDATGLYTYPDVVATCEQPSFEDEQVDTLLNPQVIVEVLSDATEAFDRGRKFEDYRTIPSLRQYVLISQKTCHIESFTRQSDNTWLLWETSSADDQIVMPQIECALEVADIYAKVQFDVKPASPGESP